MTQPPIVLPDIPMGKRIGFWLGPAVAVLVFEFANLNPDKPQATAAAAVAALMSIWWVTEAVPLAATSLLPLALFPALGVMKGSAVAAIYTDSTIAIFIGGFFIALAMERWNLHRRIALGVIRVVGGRPHRLALGFMLATGGISMWMSNTATAMMMTPMALSLALLYEDLTKKAREAGAPADPRERNFPIVILLTIAYAGSIGGFGTLVGTPTNLILVTVFKNEFPDAPPITFARWLAFGFPLSVTLMLGTWFVLCRVVYPLPRHSPFSGEGFIRDESKRLGPISAEEIKILCVFAATALLWIFRADMNLGESLTIPGWAGLLKHGGLIDDGTVAIVMGLTLFALPSNRCKDGRILDWQTAKKVPWGILLLFGGGFALAEGMSSSGLSEWIGGQFGALKGAPTWLMVLGVTLGIIALTELASNMATVTMSLPILATLARSIEVHPLVFMIPATIAASCGFMMPMGTTTNMIAYGTEKLEMMDMIRAGILVNLLAAILITLFILTVALPIFGVSPGVFPDWAAK